MYGFKKGAGHAGRKQFADGGAVEEEAKAVRGFGMVRGPGTGTSDSVKGAVPPGTYIMPADSTRQIGPDALGAAGFRPDALPKNPDDPPLGFGKNAGKVPVNLSNGEFRLSPEQVHAIGVQVLEGLKAATHNPAGEGEEDDGDDRASGELFFADGGLVEDERKKRPLATSPTNTYPGNQAERAGNIYAQSNADLARGFGDAFAGTITATRGAGQAVQDAYRTGGVGAAIGQGVRGSMVPAVGFLDDVARSAARTLDGPAQALKTLVTGDASPIGQAQAQPAGQPQAVGAPVAQTPAATTKAGQTAMPPNSGPVPYTVTPVENTNGVQRINQPGKSPLFTNIDPGQAVAEMKGNPVGIVPSAATSGQGMGFQPNGIGGPDVMGILQRESQIRAGMGELQDQINFNGGNGIGFRQRSPDEALRDMMFSDNLKARSAALGFASGNRDAALRSTQTAQELALRQHAQQRQEALQARYEAAKTPEERSAIAQQIRDLGGKEFPNRFTVVPGGQEWDANAGAMRNVPGRVINNQTGLDVERPTQGAGQQPQAMPADKAQRKAGMVYVLADGRRVKWDGTGATEVK